jgi:alpha-ketoglutarate-dependent taurine dioxygenase
MGDPIEGAFCETETDPHVRRRRQLLERGGPLPAPPLVLSPELLLEELTRRGLVVVRLDEPLANHQLLALGATLGIAMVETDPVVQPYVEQECILNLVNEHGKTEDVSLQPFAANPLTLHSEGSGRSPAEQPRFIVLLCCRPGAADAARTVLVPMAEVARRLSSEHRDVLASTRYRHNRKGPWICRLVDGRAVFSFRDFASQRLEWHHAGDRSPAEVNAAIRALLAAMYEPGIATAVAWEHGLLVVIDNTFFFHGRTAGASAGARHLKRLRLLGGRLSATGAQVPAEAPS